MTEKTNNPIAPRAPHRHKAPKVHTLTDYVRQWLNIIFMLGAVVGVIIYLASDRTIGTIIVLAAIVFKIVECILRIINR